MIFVRQTFESLGDPSETKHNNFYDADRAAWNLRGAIAEMVSGWKVPDYASKTGPASAVGAWREAERLAGVARDDNGRRTIESPTKYGITAGMYIASFAVEVDG